MKNLIFDLFRARHYASLSNGKLNGIKTVGGWRASTNQAKECAQTVNLIFDKVRRS